MLPSYPHPGQRVRVVLVLGATHHFVGRPSEGGEEAFLGRGEGREGGREGGRKGEIWMVRFLHL